MTEVIWAKGFGSTGADTGYGIATDSSNNLYTIGSFSGSVPFGTTTLTSQGNSDLYITKQDSSGNVIWAKSVPGIDSASTRPIVTDSSGNIYAISNFSGSATFGTTTLTSQGGQDFFVTRLDSSGNVSWAKSFGGTNDDNSYSIASDSSGNLYITGSFQDSVTFGNTKLTAVGLTDIFVTKLDSSGNVAWAKSFGGISTTSSDSGKSISTDNNGNIYITGTYRGTKEDPATFGAFIQE